jgi:hypothetical protein
MLQTTIDQATLLIGVLEIIKRQGNNDFSNKASIFLDKFFSYQIYGTIYIEIPKSLIKEIDIFFDEYVNIYGDYGCIGAGACDDSMINILTDYEGNIIFNPHEN